MILQCNPLVSKQKSDNNVSFVFFQIYAFLPKCAMIVKLSFLTVILKYNSHISVSLCENV